MSEPEPLSSPASSPASTPASVPAGWYQDSVTPGQMRWWDGASWTEHTTPAAPAVPAYATVPERPLLPTGAPIYSPFIWVIVLLPLLTYGLLFTWQPDFSSMTGISEDGSYDPTGVYRSLFTPSYFLIIGSSFLLWGLSVFFAFRDRVWLQRQGVVRPFHWAFAFLGGFGSLVYTIGRTVIVRRVAPHRGLAPIWVTIGVFVLGFLLTIVWTVLLTSQMISQLPSVANS